jgi:hypothetical protein
VGVVAVDRDGGLLKDQLNAEPTGSGQIRGQLLRYCLMPAVFVDGHRNWL